jgi:hypothetical protein
LRAIEIIDGKAVSARTDPEEPEENVLIQSRDVKTSVLVDTSQRRLRDNSLLVISLRAYA